LEDVHVLHCETLEQAIERIAAEKVHLIVLCYLFDDLRPFRLIHHVRNDLGRPDVPILLVRAVDWQLDEAQLRQMTRAYEGIGIDGFVDLCAEAQAHGDEAALQRFRRSVMSRLATSA
jgi:hypothetical protein